MARTEDVELKIGEGRISGVVSVFLGVSALVAVLCFHFPEYLTTPELRKGYPLELLRSVLLGGMLLSVVFGSLSVFLSKSKVLGFSGIALTLLAQWLGGANVYIDEFAEPAVSFGFDWLVLALLTNTIVFVFIERVWPHRPDQLTLRQEWRLDLLYYGVNHLAVSVILLVTTFFSEGLFGWAVNDSLQDSIRSQPAWLQFIEPTKHGWSLPDRVAREDRVAPRAWRRREVVPGHHLPSVIAHGNCRYAVRIQAKSLHGYVHA